MSPISLLGRGQTRALWLLALAVILAAGLVGAAEVGEATGKSIRIPMYSPEGRLVRHLFAESGEGRMDNLRLQDGRVDFFTRQAGETPVAWVKFDSARYDQLGSTLADDTIIRFESREMGTLVGRGYVFKLRDNRLSLRSEVRGEFEGTRLEAPQAEIAFDPSRRDAVDAIDEVLFPQGVTLTGAAVQAKGAERVHLAKARYRAETGKIYPEGKITTWIKGERAEMSADEMSYQVRPPLAPTR